MSESETLEPERPPRRRTPKDDLFDCLSLHFGIPRTRTEEVMYGKVVSELLQAGATSEETENACSYVIRNFDSPSVFSVLKWLSRAQQAQSRPSGTAAAIEQLRREQ